MGTGCCVWFTIPIQHLRACSRAVIAYDPQSNGRRIARACLLFPALMNSAFLIRRAVMGHLTSARRGKQCGTLPASGLRQSLGSTLVERS